MRKDPRTLHSQPTDRSPVDRIRVRDFGCRKDAGIVAVALVTRRRTDAHVFVGEADVQGVRIRLRMDGDGGEPQFLAGTDHAQRDLTPIGDENFLEQGRTQSGSSANSEVL